MMEGINLYSIEYYKKTVFKGSYKGVCFRVFREETGADESGDVSGDPADSLSGGEDAPAEVLRVQVWKGPYILEKTSEEVFTADFEYSNEGLKQANEWIERKQSEII